MQRTNGRSAEVGSARHRRSPGRGSVVPLFRTPPVMSLPTQPFRGLTPGERTHLQKWWKLALPAGIDMLEDLGARPWPCPVADTIIGIFRFGEEMAAWMVIGQDGAWAVANCSDGMVSRQFDSLASALSQVHPVEDLD
jgi:hypothetical protein